MRPHEILAELGNCREQEPSVMYPEPDDERGIAIAKSVCEGCVVIDLCRSEALKNRERHGIWAGMDGDELGHYRRKLGRIASHEPRTT